MIGTVAIKQQQLKEGSFKTGTGSEIILIMGSCRSVPYLNYLHEWNIQNGNRFTIAFIDPFNNNWNEHDERVDYNQALAQCETNENILNLLRSTTIFIHEYYANAGMFNCDKNSPKNIYQFGLKPEQDICLPNFNDVFILTADIVSFDIDIKRKAIQDYNVIGRLSELTLNEIEIVREKQLQRFYDICAKTDCPEFAFMFESRYKEQRMFWTFNHISKGFSLAILALINSKFLKLYFSPDLWDKIIQQDMYANNYTHLCEYDKGYNYNEPVKQLKEIL